MRGGHIAVLEFSVLHSVMGQIYNQRVECRESLLTQGSGKVRGGHANES